MSETTGRGRRQTCPSDCDDDCEALCHEDHQVTWKKEHTREECPAYATDAASRQTRDTP